MPARHIGDRALPAGRDLPKSPGEDPLPTRGCRCAPDRDPATPWADRRNLSPSGSSWKDRGQGSGKFVSIRDPVAGVAPPSARWRLCEARSPCTGQAVARLRRTGAMARQTAVQPAPFPSRIVPAGMPSLVAARCTATAAGANRDAHGRGAPTRAGNARPAACARHPRPWASRRDWPRFQPLRSVVCLCSRVGSRVPNGGALPDERDRRCP